LPFDRSPTLPNLTAATHIKFLDREQLFSVEKMAATISVSEGSFRSNNFDDLMQLQARDLTGTIRSLAISIGAEFRGSDCARHKRPQPKFD
jgi:hypothetical protein